MEQHGKDSRKIILPNLVTTFGMLLGFLSIFSSLDGKMHEAGVYLFTSIILDFIDGRVARLTGTESDFGKEYDSLSDFLSFGVAPALFIYVFFLRSFGEIGIVLSFVYAACTALRLARFNIQQPSTDGKNFIGLPCPMAAGSLISIALIFEMINTQGPMLILLLALLHAILMISSLEFRSFKDIKIFPRLGLKEFLAFLIVILFLIFEPVLFFFSVTNLYIALGLAENFYSFLKKSWRTV